MADLPEALRLADRLTAPNAGPWDNYDAAAELRRLHAENQSLRAALAQAEPVAWRTFDGEGGLAAGVNPSFLDVSRATEQFVKPTRSQQMADAGFTPRDNRLQCDECGGKFSRQMLPIHNCPQQTEPVQCEHCSSPLFAALECRVCGRKEAK